MSDEYFSSSEDNCIEIQEKHKRSKGLCHCCYLLCSLNEKRKGTTYIGYTVDPFRRLNQHNRGKMKGGARKTSGKGPWKSVVVVSGFPNEISALRFEWAWQNPEKSTRLKHIVPTTKRFCVDFKLNVLENMLRIGPWNRLCLTVNWIDDGNWERKMLLLEHTNINRMIFCSFCFVQYHINCLADRFTDDEHIIPIMGECFDCGKVLKWSDLVKQMKLTQQKPIKE